MNADIPHPAAGPLPEDPVAGEAAADPGVPLQQLPGWIRVMHWSILFFFVSQLFYATWQVFVVLQPEGHVGPAFGAAATIPYEQMVVRRLYAIEGWVSFLGMSAYLGITEILPRRQGASRR